MNMMCVTGVDRGRASTRRWGCRRARNCRATQPRCLLHREQRLVRDPVAASGRDSQRARAVPTQPCPHRSPLRVAQAHEHPFGRRQPIGDRRGRTPRSRAAPLDSDYARIAAYPRRIA